MGRSIGRGWRGISRGCRSRCGRRGSARAIVDLPDKHSDIFSFIVIGNGGAALAGDMLRGFVAHTAQIPVVIVRGYDVPAFVGPDSIAIALSHSGNTEETVAAFEEAIDRGVKPVIVTTGGTLEWLATTHRAPLVTYTAEEKPRDALASMFTALVAIAHAVQVDRRCRRRYGRGDCPARRGARRLRPRCGGGPEPGEADGARARRAESRPSTAARCSNPSRGHGRRN